MQITPVKRVSADVIWVKCDKTIATGCSLEYTLLFHSAALEEIVVINKRKKYAASRKHELLSIAIDDVQH